MSKISFCAGIVVLVALVGNLKADDDDVNLQNAPPVVVKAVPQAGMDAVDPLITQIKVTYSKDMKDGSWSWSTAGKDNFPDVVGKPHYLEDHRTCVLSVHLKAGKTYAMWLNSQNFGGFKDVDGNSAVPYLLVFRTRDDDAKGKV